MPTPSNRKVVIYCKTVQQKKDLRKWARMNKVTLSTYILDCLKDYFDNGIL